MKSAKTNYKAAKKDREYDTAKSNTGQTMSLVTELGRAGRENIWLEVGEDVRTERIEVRAS